MIRQFMQFQLTEEFKELPRWTFTAEGRMLGERIWEVVVISDDMLCIRRTDNGKLRLIQKNRVSELLKSGALVEAVLSRRV